MTDEVGAVPGTSGEGADATPSTSLPSTSLPSTSYEAARDELAEIVRRLETGGTTLEESLQLWERAEALVSLCQKWLDGARARLDAAREA